MKNVSFLKNVNRRAIFLAACALLILVMGSIFAVASLRSVIKQKDRVAFQFTETLLAVERLTISAERKIAAGRGYLLNPGNEMYESMLKARGDFLITLNQLDDVVKTPEGRKYLTEVETAEKKHQDVLDGLLLRSQKNENINSVNEDFRRLLLPRSLELVKTLNEFEKLKLTRLNEMRERSVEYDDSAMRIIYIMSLLLSLMIPVIVFYILRLLNMRNKLEDIRHSEERLGLAIKFSGMGIWDWRLRDRNLIWNENTEIIFEYPLGTKDHPFSDFENRIHVDDRDMVRNSLQEAIDKNSDFRAEFRIVTSKGTKWIISLGKAIYEKDNTPCRMVGIVVDISDRKLFEKKLQASVRAREEVLAVVSHDLRNPLGVMLMSAGMIERKLKDSPNDDWIRGQAEKIKKSGQRMNELIEDLLSLTKIEAGHFTLQKEHESVRELMEEVTENAKSLASEKHLRVEVEIPAQDKKLDVDHNQILRVFGNIISNGIKFSPPDGLLKIAADYREEEVIFSISDTGPGIAEHHINNVFDRFWQAQGTAHKGTGLGLAISKGIVQAHGGNIWVRSTFGEGATFCFALPYKSAA